MVSLGMALTTADFRRVFVQPRGISIGIVNLAVISPLLAFGIAELYDLEPALAVGLVLLGASPGGTMANLLTHLARGDTALSISITAISSLAAVATVPLFLSLAIDRFGAEGFDEDIEMLGVVARVLLITVVPLGIGMWLRARRPERIAEVQPAVPEGGVRPLPRDRRRRHHRRERARLREPRLRRRRSDHAEPRRDGDLVHDRAAGAAQRPPVDRDRDRARRPQHRARDRRRGRNRHRADDPGRGLRVVHVRHARACSRG